jgi:hypothetical protein
MFYITDLNSRPIIDEQRKEYIRTRILELLNDEA